MWTKPSCPFWSSLAACPSLSVVVGGVPLLRRGGLPLVLSLAACPLRAWQQMPPKKAKPEPKPNAEALALENINGKYFDDLATAMSVVLAHKLFSRTLKALPKEKGGIIEPLSEATFQSGEVIVGANLASINEAHLVLPGVPMQQTKIDKLRNHFFKAPARPDGVVVGYIGDDFPIVNQLGSWTCVSPVETIHAFWAAVAQDIKGNNKSTIEEWAVMARTTPVKFKRFPDADAFIYFNETERWKTLTASVAITHSPFQRIFVIYNFKKRAEASSKETVTDVQIKNQLTENVTFPDDSIMAEDKMSQHFVSQAREGWGGSHPQSSALAACPNYHHHLSITIILVGGLPQPPAS